MVISPYQDDLLDLAIQIVHAGNCNDTRSQWALHNELRSAVERHEGTRADHPMHWETLADFTPNVNECIGIYTKAVKAAEARGFDERAASIYFQLAKTQYELGDKKEAELLARKASTLATKVANFALRDKVCGFLLTLASELFHNEQTASTTH